MVDPRDCSMWIWEKCVFCYCWLKCSIDVWFIVFIVLLKSSISISLFCLFHLLLKVGYWRPQLWLRNCLLLPSILSVFALCTSDSKTQICLQLLCLPDRLTINWLFYHYKMIFFLSSDNFCLKLYFFLKLVYHSSSLLVIACIVYSFHPFCFQIIYIFNIKCVCCRQKVVGSFFKSILPISGF